MRGRMIYTVLFLVLVGLVLLAAVNVNRSTAVAFVVGLYPGEKSSEGCPFTDIADDPHREAICQAYNLRITAGTTATTFSPKEKALWWQWMVFFGKLGMALEYS